MKFFKRRKEIIKTSFFWLYIVAGALLVLISLFFAPFWSDIVAKFPDTKEYIIWAPWWSYALGIMVGVAIVIYLVVVLYKRIKKPGIKNNVKIIMISEFALLVVLAVLAVLKAILDTNSFFQFLNIAIILGIIIWVRGFVEIINAYYYEKESEQKYSVWFLLMNIALITVAPIVFIFGLENPYVDYYVAYFFCAVVLFIGSYLIVYGALSKPIKVKESPIEESPLLEQKLDEPQEETLKIETSEEPLLIEEDNIQETEEKVEQNVENDDDSLVEVSTVYINVEEEK